MMMALRSSVVAGLTLFASLSTAQTFQRLGACPQLGCVFPPDLAEFLPGQWFDVRTEVHLPVNGSEARNGTVDRNFKLTIAKGSGAAQDFATYFKIAEPPLENWTFSYYEDLFAQDAKRLTGVNVTAKAYRKIALYEPGDYKVTLTYYNSSSTIANWHVRPLSTGRKAKNVIFFLGDGMTTNMITAARLISKKSINGKYQSRMAMDTFPFLGHQMTHSLDTFITDSANSISALLSGHKTTVNALNVYVDSSPNVFDDPKVETIAEIFHRYIKGAIGVVTTAFIADATPAGPLAHTRARSQYGAIVDQALSGVKNYSWVNWSGPDVYFGTGSEQFTPGSGSFQGKDYYAEFRKAGYSVSLNKTALAAASNSSKALGIFSTSNLPVWLDRNVYKDTLNGRQNAPDGSGKDALDLPGLKEMTLKAIDVLQARSNGSGFFLLSEGASIDKQMHTLDYDRALGDLIEFDDTINATINHLRAIGELNNTLIVVTADHGHGFDVYGGVDTRYLAAANTTRSKRNAIGTYQNSGLSQYTVNNASINYGTGPNFPVNWEPRYALAQGFGAFPDHRENFRVNKEGPRTPATNLTGGLTGSDFYAASTDDTDGFLINGTLPLNNDQGVHSLTDVPVFATGPCAETFTGVYNNVDLFFLMADCLGLGRATNSTS